MTATPLEPAFSPRVRVTAERIDIAAEIDSMGGGGAAGALVTFCGYCRDEGGRLKALELEHYPGMAERQIATIAARAAARWPLLGALAIHRYGLVAPGEEIVFVACSSVHRGAAFEAASFLMDFMKTRAPFWKREHLVDGTVGGWVEAKDTDEAASDRWHRL
ncbi:molybdenum cofactor biosynthesis protein MoaE [Aurantimonas sp. Leaf443]|uniref:molybdenum cofactor biosynthesis protein MoaE n=1 Tax=Aurantimonas sp. Leaf443 TaxID=1736378 RepID=UPI0006F7A8FE|nr:molybdenum cofactor biosynthesis protein MoaE [Aurantimonas sp. Leaf443]KQT88412.1 molybdopterin synthase catalytic subunit [Aurantimonas sp. Leaf443]